MSRDYQKEYNDLYKEYLEYTETVDESTKDQTDMNKFYDAYILKYQSKRDYVVDYMNKIVTDAKAEGIKIKERPIKYYKIKRSEDMDVIEDRAKSIKDYQKEYDEAYLEYEDKLKSLGKNDKLTKEAFKKVQEKEDIIGRAIDDIEDDLSEIDSTINKLSKDIESKKKQLKNYKPSSDNDKGERLLENEIKDLTTKLAIAEENKKILNKKLNELKKIKRSESMDNLEIEERALNTEQDYQKEYDNLKKQYNFFKAQNEKASERYSKKLKELNELSKDARAELDKAMKANNDEMDNILDKVTKLQAEAKSKGFKIKRSEENDDIELRALNTQEDYQHYVDRYIKQYNNIRKKIEEHEEIIKDYQKELKECLKEIDETQLEGKKKGFKVNTGNLGKRSEEATDLETRKKEIVANLTDLEERKNEILSNLETRALKTQDDYQKAYDELKDKALDINGEITKIQKQEREEVNKVYDKYATLRNKLVKQYNDLCMEGAKLEKEAKSKGFKIKN